MSRWMMPFWWACWTAWQTGTNSSSRCARRELVVVAVLGDRDAVDQLHDEVGPAAVGRAGVEDPGDVRVVHQRQGLPLGLEAGDDLPVSMPGLMIFRATLRRTGCCCSAMKTTPMPPSPICCSSLYGPMTVPGPLGDGLVARSRPQAGRASSRKLPASASWARSSRSTSPRAGPGRRRRPGRGRPRRSPAAACSRAARRWTSLVHGRSPIVAAMVPSAPSSARIGDGNPGTNYSRTAAFPSLDRGATRRVQPGAGVGPVPSAVAGRCPGLRRPRRWSARRSSGA